MKDDEESVRAMFWPLLDIPPIATVRREAPGVWVVTFTDSTTATAYPLERRWVDHGRSVPSHRR